MPLALKSETACDPAGNPDAGACTGLSGEETALEGLPEDLVGVGCQNDTEGLQGT